MIRSSKQRPQETQKAPIAVVTAMRGAVGEDLEIIRGEVPSVAVLVMDFLSGPQIPTEHLGCHMAMHEKAALESGVVVLLCHVVLRGGELKQSHCDPGHGHSAVPKPFVASDCRMRKAMRLGQVGLLILDERLGGMLRSQLSTVGLTAKHIASTEVLTSTWATGLSARRKPA